MRAGWFVPVIEGNTMNDHDILLEEAFVDKAIGAAREAIADLNVDPPSWRETITETIKDLTWRRGRRVFDRISNTVRRVVKMSGGPDKIPPGSWGGDLDPNQAQQRANFEAGLEAQGKQLQQLHQQAAAPGAAQHPTHPTA